MSTAKAKQAEQAENTAEVKATGLSFTAARP